MRGRGHQEHMTNIIKAGYPKPVTLEGIMREANGKIKKPGTVSGFMWEIVHYGLCQEFLIDGVKGVTFLPVHQVTTTPDILSKYNEAGVRWKAWREAEKSALEAEGSRGRKGMVHKLGLSPCLELREEARKAQASYDSLRAKHLSEGH
jgi:hypothetical protein